MKPVRLKLIDRFTLWFMAVTALALLAGGVIVFDSVQREIMQEDTRRLKDTVKLLAKRLQQGSDLEQLEGYQVDIQELNYAAPILPLQVLDTLAWFPPHQHYERELRARASYRINGKHYAIAVSNLVPEPDEIAEGVIQSLAWTFILLLFLVTLSGRLFSRWLLAPFHHTLQSVQSFAITRQEPLRLAPTQTEEFDRLNQFLEKMTRKAVEDYQSLKEFTENASHELQTPLAVIRGKLELLMESPINQQQAGFILTAHQAVEKLSKINQALILLTKLENKEYKASKPIDLSQLICQTMAVFEELLEMKALTLETQIAEKVQLQLNPYLADILLNNLLSNAIRHNVPDGKIRVELTCSRLTVQNTGNLPRIAPELMFGRFKKSNQSTDSVGLGLAIVKQICDLNGFHVSYRYSTPLHTLEVNFKPTL